MIFMFHSYKWPGNENTSPDYISAYKSEEIRRSEYGTRNSVPPHVHIDFA